MKYQKLSGPGHWAVTFIAVFLLISCTQENVQPVTTSTTTNAQVSMSNVDKGILAKKMTCGSPVTAPGYLCIYYSWPSVVNLSYGNVEAATNVFKKFDVIVFGAGLWQDIHSDHVNTIEIMKGLHDAGKKVFGYVNMGCIPTTIAEMTQAIDSWKAMEAYGIFLDCAGFDYGVTREMQTTVINYCHNNGLKVFMNAWNPDDVMGGVTAMGAEDFYLAESYLVGHDNYFPLTDWVIKANKCKNYSATLGVKIACVSTAANVTDGYNTTDKFSMSWVGTALYNFDYFQMTDYYYSAANSFAYFFPNLSEQYGAHWTSDLIKISDDHYLRYTDQRVLHIYGDGSTTGYGAIRDF